MKKGNLKIFFKDNIVEIITGYKEDKIKELVDMLNNKFNFLRLEMINKKQVIINKRNIQNIIFEPTIA